MMSAPSACISRARSIAWTGSKFWPPSENESGVTLRTPTTIVRGPRRIVLPLGRERVNSGLKIVSRFSFLVSRLKVPNQVVFTNSQLQKRETRNEKRETILLTQTSHWYQHNV